MKEFVLDDPLSPDFLRFLELFGTVKQFPHLRRPYFSFEQEHFISVKGFVGDANIEVRFRKENADLIADYFHLLLYYAGQGTSGIRKMQEITESIRTKMKTRLPEPGDST